MHVREFQKPVTMVVPTRLPKQPEGGSNVVGHEDVLRPYRYEDYIAEFVWSQDKWNTEESWQDAQIRIGDAIDAAKEGEMIKFDSLDDWEKFHEANKNAKIVGTNAHRIRKLQKAGKNARQPQKEDAKALP